METWNTLSPADSSQDSIRRQRIVDFWMELDAFEEAGGNSWEALLALRNEVTSSLWTGDLAEAESLTAQALFYLEAFGS